MLEYEYADGTNCRDPQVFHAWWNEIRASFGLKVLLDVAVDLEGVVHVGPTNAQHDYYKSHKHHISLAHLALLLFLLWTFLLLLYTLI